MPLPGNLSTGIVTGTFLAYDGEPVQGQIRFTAEAPYALDAAADVILVSLSRSVQLDADGHFEITLVATDDADLVPLDFTYRVRPMVTGLPMPAFSIEVAGGSTQDLADIAPVPGSGGTLPEGPLDPAVADLVPGPSLTHDALVDLIEDTADASAVLSVNGETGAVVLTKGDIGLGNVDNTTDAAKPVSTATQTALNAKAGLVHSHDQADVTGLSAALAGKADDAHTHAAADVTSGTLAVARIGSGTPAAGKYVDGGTGAWTDLPEGGGGGETSPLVGRTYPVDAYGFFATSIQPENVTSSANLDVIWSVRLPVLAGQEITRAGLWVHTVGSGLSGLAGFALYDDDGDLITSTVTDTSVFTTVGWRFKSFPSPVAAEGADRYVWLRAQVETQTAGAWPIIGVRTGPDLLNGGLSAHRRVFYNGSRVSAWPSDIDPLTDGSEGGGYIPLMGLG